MPFISIKAAGRALGADEVRALQQDTTGLMAEVMGKQAEVTAVLVEEAAPANWSIGGKTLSDSGAIAAHVDIKITLGTNTIAQKARMLAETRRMLERVLPDLSPVSYVVIDEIPATDWGYGGFSQDARKSGAG